jgi:light-regulated signal transduction histidine kinase (bacteriophytochrome)
MIIASEETASLSAVVSMVHDLRNPLATIHGSAEMLAGARLSQPQVHRIARNMYCASVRMRELLEEFLDRSRVVTKEGELSNTRELVASAVDKISAIAEFQSVHVVQVVPEGLIVPVDRRLIRRVLVNLLEGRSHPHRSDFRRLFHIDSDSRYRAGDHSRDSGPALSIFRNCRQGCGYRPWPCLFTAGCDRSRRQDMGRVD